MDEDDPQFERMAEGASRMADLIEGAMAKMKKKKRHSKRKSK